MNPNDEPRTDVRADVLAEVGINRIDVTATPTPISEVLDELMPSGTKIKLGEVVDQSLVILAVRPFQGKFGPAAFVVFADENGELYNTVIGQKIVLPKLFAAMDRLPVSCKIVKKEGGSFGSYYDIE